MADYCTAAELKAALPDGSWGTAYDTLLATLVTRASRAIDRFTGRPANSYAADADTTRYFTGSGSAELWVGELAAAPTSVALAEGGSVTAYTTLAGTDYTCWPYNAALEGRPYRRLDLDTLNGAYSHWYRYPRAVKVVGRFGYSTTAPAEVVQATLIQAARWFKRGQQAFADTGAVVELGQLTYTQQLDPDVALLVQHLRRTVV